MCGSRRSAKPELTPPDRQSTDRVMDNANFSVVVIVSLLVAATVGLWTQTSDGDGDNLLYEHVYDIKAETGTTFLAFDIRAAQPAKVKIDWMAEGSWYGSRAAWIRNVRLHNVSDDLVLRHGWSVAGKTSCHGINDSRRGISVCPHRNLDLDGTFQTEGTLLGREVWYTAAFGADEATLRVRISSNESLEVGPKVGGKSRLLVLKENRTDDGEVEGKSAFRVQRLTALRRPSYGVFGLLGEYNETPSFQLSTESMSRLFRPSTPLYETATGMKASAPGSPLDAGPVRIKVEGGRRSNETGEGEIAALVLGVLNDPGFVDADGSFNQTLWHHVVSQ